MIELRFVVPFKVFDFATDAETSKKISDKKIGEYLLKNRWFVENLAEYYSESDKYDIKAIIPWAVEHDSAGHFIDIKAYSNAETLSDTDIFDITDYIKGQVSDGWGENGFDLFDGLHLDFDWKNVVHNGSKFITDKEFNDIFDIFKGRQIKAIEEDETSQSFISDPNEDNLLKLIDETIEHLTKLADKLEKIKV